MWSASEFRKRAVAFDTETHKIQPGLLIPPLVCASYAWWDFDKQTFVGKLLAGRARYRDPALNNPDALEVFRSLLVDRILVGLNLAFDMAVMARYAAECGIDIIPTIYRAYEENRVFDLGIAEAEHAIAHGYLGLDPRTTGRLRDPVTRKLSRYSLSVTMDLTLGHTDAKDNDGFRMRYAALEGVPIEDWEREAQVYPVDDVINPLKAAFSQFGLIPRRNYDDPTTFALQRNYNLHDVPFESYAAFALHLGAAWGFSVDVERVLKLEQELVAKREKARPAFIDLTFIRMQVKKGVQKYVKTQAVIKRRVAEAYGCTKVCEGCGGTGKVPSSNSGKPVGHRNCDSTGLDLDSCFVPRTKGSKCRTCKSTGFVTPKKGDPHACTNCKDQPELIPGCQTSRDTLRESGDEDLIEFAVYLEEAKLLETYIPFLKKGISEVPLELLEDEEDGLDDA